MVLRLPTSANDSSTSLLSARRDAIVLGVLIGALCLLIWNGSNILHEIAFADADYGAAVDIASTALSLNVALILFGWRRYVDLRQDAARLLDTEKRAAQAATTDAVTGLLNRKGFADRLEAMVPSIGDRQLVVLVLQINRLKMVSDRHGYEVGDAVRREIAAAIQNQIPADATVGRLSGDEFAIALPLDGADLTPADALGDAVLRSVTHPYTVSGYLVEIGAYAGLSASSGGAIRIPDLLRRADIATDHARNGRSARAVWFDEGMERALVAQTEIEQGIRYGLDHDQFLPYFEPQIDLATGDIVGFEVLARWQHPSTGLISPDNFIPIAEEMNLIGRLSEQVFSAALVEARNWDPSVKIGINISPAQLTEGWLAQRILRLLTETAFPAERLVVEITETSLFADFDLARSVVRSLKNQGIRIALDDFGTGYSSLSHLRELPFDIIKIDRSFVTNIHTNGESAAIVRAVSTLAAGLDVPVAVEGIECEASHAAVLKLGCTFGQGWYFGKPMPAEQAAQLLLPMSASDVAAPRQAAAG